MARDDSGRALERVLARPVADATRAVWGFTNRTDIVTLEGGERVVVQRYRRREDAEYRLRVMQALWAPAAEAGIAIPRVRESDLDADPPWVMFDALPGVPVPENAGLEGPRFPAMARSMGELLAAFRGLPSAGLELDELWAAPVNVLTDGRSLTGLLDFESVRLADPLFDVAWWAWAFSFSAPAESAWPAFLDGAGIDATDPELPVRIRALQVLRMLELLAGESLDAGVRRIVADRLRTTIAEAAPAAIPRERPGE
jgi:aminoglycoside phosphotransferase